MDEVSAFGTWLRERPSAWGFDFLFVSQKSRFNSNTVNRIFAKYCRLASDARVNRGARLEKQKCLRMGLEGVSFRLPEFIGVPAGSWH
jgi:hypothetical protein